MDEDTVTIKDAAFMLDTDMEQDMASYRAEITMQAIKYINSNSELYNYVKGNMEHGLSVKDSATTWAKNHNDELGSLFITELDLVDWEKVKERV